MADKTKSLEKTQDRIVRVFVSSTFSDMHAEREELVKRIFPELRKRCRERFVELTEVDLRWGISDEQKAEGKVLPICLAEIERCRPYFIGILGERYGWVPEEIDKELAEVQSWLKEHREKSVTELEIIHGVLKNPAMERLSFFYFRSPETSGKVEKELSKKPGYSPEPNASYQKLKSLKEEIFNHEKKYPVSVRRDFPDAKTIGQLVLEDLWKAIDKRFPIEKVPSALERERMEHEAFAEARRKVYIGRDEYYHRLNDHVSGQGNPLVLLGESGSGKSALIANWMAQYRKARPDDFLIARFIGGTAGSADYVTLLRGIMEEIKERYEPAREGNIPSPLEGEGKGEGAIPTDPKKIVEAFPLWLAKAAAKGRFILVLDALNQLEDRDNAPDLGWLPTYFPANARVILSTLPGRSLNVLEKLGWERYTVGLLNEDERKRLIPLYLKQYTKELSPPFVERIATAGQTANPLYLKALLDELRVYGDHLTLGKRIDYYLEAQTVGSLYERILKRYEEDYERDRPGLVRDAMSLLWASRRGLSETELLELLGAEGEPLLRAHWSPLYLAVEESLVSRSGLLNFFHDFLRRAVEDKYLQNRELKQEAHLRLAGYFDKKELSDRKVDELPWQFKEAEEWERLKDCVANIDMFLKLMTEAKRYELTGYWLAIGNRYDMVESYNYSIEHFEKTEPKKESLAYLFNWVARFFEQNAKYDGAKPLNRRALAIREKVLGPEHPDTATSINNLALLLYTTGRYEEAEPLYKRALAIREKVLGPEHPDTAGSINNLAELLRATGRYEEAEPLYKRALTIYEKVLGPEHPDTAQSLYNLAYLIFISGDGKGAAPYYQRALEVYEKIAGATIKITPQLLNTMAICHNQVAFHSDVPSKSWKKAEEHYRQSIALFKKVPNQIEADNVELNLQTLFHLSGQKVDIKRVRELTQSLESAGDKRAEKGQRLLTKGQ